MEKRNSDGLTEAEFLKCYNAGDYERPSVTVDMLVFAMSEELSSLRVLLVRRKNHPYIGGWALAGGFVGIDESAYSAACRELEEETGLKNVYLEQLYTMSQPDRDPRMRVISIAYMALMQEMPVVAGDDADDALWFDVSFVLGSPGHIILRNHEHNIIIRYSLKEKTYKNGVVKTKGFIPVLETDIGLAFDHAEILVEGLLRLRNKVKYTDVAFNLVSMEFTLPDIQRVYELLLGEKLYRSNFRGALAGKVEQLPYKIKSIVGGQKSQAFRYRG